MPILMPKDTRDALGANAEKCESRSLLLDRFADPSATKDDRKAVFTRAFGKRAETGKIASWHAFLRDGLRLKDDGILYAQLQSRLMVNMAGGVMENAGLCLDRFGLPYIPGSAVKGCARRMAIQELLEAREAGKSSNELAQLLADIALTFGWGEQDWSGQVNNGRCVSDFAYAVDRDSWESVSTSARGHLTRTDHFAGSVSFLPAFPVDLGKPGRVDDLPVELPPLGKLELDVVTCHHGKYYSKAKDRSGSLVMPVALDTEEPVPVVFPAVAAGHVFAFALLSMRGYPRQLLDQARTWLANGLANFGLGAKTAAGYGWFDASQQFNERVIAKLQAQKQAEADRIRQAQDVTLAAEKASAERAERDRKRASLTRDNTWIEKFKAAPEGKRRETINKFAFDDEKWWPPQGELADERIQFSLLHFLLHVEPEFLTADRANPKSKTAKALSGLKRKFLAA